MRTIQHTQARQRRDYYEALIRQKEAELRHARAMLRGAQRDLAQAIAEEHDG